MMDQVILKNIFLTNIYQIPKNFLEQLKTVIEYLFRTENFVDISFEIIPPLFKMMEAQSLLILLEKLKPCLFEEPSL